MTIAAKEPVWLKVYERDGRTLYMGTMAAGQHYTVPATAADPLIRTGRPQSVALTIGATALPALAAPDTLVKDRSLKRDALVGGAPAGIALMPTAASAAPPAMGRP